MKHLILSLLACFFLCTACFEKEEIEKEEEVKVAPPKVDILKCEIIQRFINYAENNPPKMPRAYIKKFSKGNEYIFETYSGGEAANEEDDLAIAYRNSNCEAICGTVYWTVGASKPCPNGFYDSLVYMETVWIDER